MVAVRSVESGSTGAQSPFESPAWKAGAPPEILRTTSRLVPAMHSQAAQKSEIPWRSLSL
jgi:hypothetical protein